MPPKTVKKRVQKQKQNQISLQKNNQKVVINLTQDKPKRKTKARIKKVTQFIPQIVNLGQNQNVNPQLINYQIQQPLQKATPPIITFSDVFNEDYLNKNLLSNSILSVYNPIQSNSSIDTNFSFENPIKSIPTYTGDEKLSIKNNENIKDYPIIEPSLIPVKIPNSSKSSKSSIFSNVKTGILTLNDIYDIFSPPGTINSKPAPKIPIKELIINENQPPISTITDNSKNYPPIVEQTKFKQLPKEQMIIDEGLNYGSASSISDDGYFSLDTVNIPFVESINSSNFQGMNPNFNNRQRFENSDLSILNYDSYSTPSTRDSFYNEPYINKGSFKNEKIIVENPVKNIVEKPYGRPILKEPAIKRTRPLTLIQLQAMAQTNNIEITKPNKTGGYKNKTKKELEDEINLSFS